MGPVWQGSWVFFSLHCPGDTPARPFPSNTDVTTSRGRMVEDPGRIH